MENLERRRVLDFDIDKQLLTDTTFKQGDKKSSIFEFNLLKGSKFIDVTGEDIQFRFSLPNKVIIFQDISTGVTILPTGSIECILGDVIGTSGVIKCEIHRQKVDVELTTLAFYFTIESSIGEDGVASGNYIGAIETELSKITTAEALRVAQYNLVQSKLLNNEFVGANGAQGIQGVQGIQGGIGATGSIGLTGMKGDTGVAGANSVTTSTTNGNIKVNNVEQKVYNDAAVVSALAQNANYLRDLFNLFKYGVKFNGVDDDGPGIELALKDGNITIPPNSTIYIASTVHITNSQRIIDCKESTLVIASGVTAFQIGSLDMTNSLLNIVIKNIFVDMSRGGNFCLSYNSYFIKFDNIRMTQLTGNNFGIKIWNGFNITFTEVHISGLASSPSEATISGNNAIGIHVYLSSVGINVNVGGTINATNILFENCLIQRVKYGVKYEVIDGVFDTNKMSNIGFSNCDFPFYEIGGSDSHFVNQDISTIRAEYCGVMVTNIGYLTLSEVYCYNTNNLMDNTNVSSVIGLKGTILHWNPVKTGCSVIKSNLGLIDFSGANTLNFSSGTTEKSVSGVYGNIKPCKATFKNRPNGLTSLAISPFYIEIIDQQTYLPFANITGYTNGSEFYIKSSNGSNVALDDNEEYRFGDTLNAMLHCIVINGVITIDGKSSIFATNTINTAGYGISLKNKIHFVTATVSLGNFGFDSMGIIILSSITNGVKLSNGTNSILNFSDVLADTQTKIDLYNNVCIMLPSGRGDGKGYVITTPKITHSV